MSGPASAANSVGAEAPSHSAPGKLAASPCRSGFSRDERSQASQCCRLSVGAEAPPTMHPESWPQAPVGAASAATSGVRHTNAADCLSGLKPLLQCTQEAGRKSPVGAASAATSEARHPNAAGYLSGLKPLLQCTHPVGRESLVGATSVATSEALRHSGHAHRRNRWLGTTPEPILRWTQAPLRRPAATAAPPRRQSRGCAGWLRRHAAAPLRARTAGPGRNCAARWPAAPANRSV